MLPHLLPLLPSSIRSSPGHRLAGIALTLSRRSPEPSELAPVVDSFLHLISSPSRYTYRFPVIHWCSCALLLPVFAGPLPGTAMRRLGRRTLPSSSLSYCCPSTTPPSRALLRSRRSCVARPSRRKARRRREHT
jgi:hypothetical protein